MLYAKVLAASTTAARLLSIDTSVAERLPGLSCRAHGKDVPVANEMTSSSGRPTTPAAAFEGLFRVLANRSAFHGRGGGAGRRRDARAAERAIRAIRVEVRIRLPASSILARRSGPTRFASVRPTQPGLATTRSAGRCRRGVHDADVIVEGSNHVPFRRSRLSRARVRRGLDRRGPASSPSGSRPRSSSTSAMSPTSCGIPHNKVRVDRPHVGRPGFGGNEDMPSRRTSPC